MPAARLPLSELLTPDRLAEAGRLRARFPTDPTLAAELVRRGWVTPMQGRWIARGHGNRLLVGGYVLLDRLGQGGMGQVFLARHRGLGRRAAVKVIRPDREARASDRERFAREVRVLGRLNHLNVVHAYDAGADGRALYLVMEYVPGPDLGASLADGPLPPGVACEYARQAALGLAHLHAHGLVHRDVKPTNLALAAAGRVVKVLDVGLARDRVPGGGDLTRTGVLVGTADYAAPEQMTDSRRVGRRADQYGLGCTLYKLLTGCLPFPGPSPVSRALRRLAGDPVPLAEVRPGLPAGLEAVVARLIARHPEGRFPTAADAAAALARFASPIDAVGDTDTAHPTVDGGVLPALRGWVR